MGNLQVDYVAQWGPSTAGQYVQTLSAVDISTGWWESEAIGGRSRAATQQGLDRIRHRLPYGIREIHPDNDTGMINDLLWRYCRKARIKMSRSRRYQKNDNAGCSQDALPARARVGADLSNSAEASAGAIRVFECDGLQRHME